MSSDKIDQLLNSDYDGIQEYDNDLPRWWVYLFVLTAVFGVVYTGYIHFTGRPTDHELLAAEMKALEGLKASGDQISGAPSADALLAVANDPARGAKGRAVFEGKCLACHGANGEGTIGPNLTDEFWIHGGSIDKIQHTVEAGVLDKGMLAWKGVLPPEDIENVVAFVWSIRNTNLPGKAAQGTKE